MKKELEKILNDSRVIICVGSGGVGKTTVSASLGIKAAKMGKRVLVMTIDPARRLRVALGITDEKTQLSRVPNQNYDGEIYANLLNAEEIFTDFIKNSSEDPEKAERLVRNRLYKELSTTLSGSQEFTSLLQLSRVVNAKSYDLIILDTPPAQHAIDFLKAPQKIQALFQGAVVKWFVGDIGKVNIIRKMISKGTHSVLSALEYITGSRFMVELNDFFKSVSVVQDKISECTTQVSEILRDKQTKFILVTGFDEAKLIEAEQLRKYLQGEAFHLGAGIINRAYPRYDITAGEVHGPIQKIYDDWSKYQKEREQKFSKFINKWGAQLPVVRLPEFNHDIDGLIGLEEIANEMDMDRSPVGGL